MKTFSFSSNMTVGTILLLSLCLSPLSLLAINRFKSNAVFPLHDIEYYRASALVGIIVSIHNLCIFLIDTRNSKHLDLRTTRLFLILAILLPNFTIFVFSYWDYAENVSIFICTVNAQLCIIFMGMLCQSKYMFDDPNTVKFRLTLIISFVTSIVINSYSNIFNHSLDRVLNFISASLLIISFLSLIQIYFLSKITFFKYFLLSLIKINQI